jgi:very-short-patch-repair endonuclease
LQSLGLTVLRFSNADINSRFDGVCQAIYQYLKQCE